MADVIEFYKKAVESVGLTVNSNDVINFEGVEVLVDNKPLVMPTQSNIDTLVAKNDDGTLAITKVLFNPLNENALKAEGPGITKITYISRVMFAQSIQSAGKLLLILGKTKEEQKSTPMFLNEFLGKLGKEALDDKTIENWDKITDKAGHNAVDIKNKKLGTLNGDKFIRLASLSYSVYDELCNNKEHVVHGVKIRARDREVFKAVIELLIPGIEEVAADSTSHILYYGTNDKLSPSFVAIYGLLNKIGSVMAKVKKSLLKLDITLDNEIVNWSLTNDEIILAPSNYKAVTESIPNDMDIINSINKDVSATKETSAIASIINKPIGSLSTVVNPNTVGLNNGFLDIKKPNVSPTLALPTIEELSPIEKILGRRNSDVVNNDGVFSPFATPAVQTTLSSSAFGNSNINIAASLGLGGITSMSNSAFGGMNQIRL